MKKNLYLLTLVFGFTFLTSCGDDDEPTVNPIVGEWKLDKITISEPPTGYEFASTSTPTATILAESRYEFEFLADGTYERTLNETIFGRSDDEGVWEIDGDRLDLDQDNFNVDGLPTSFTIDGEITERSMTLITKDLWLAWPPSIVNDPNNPLDTVDFSNTEEGNAFFAEYGEIVEFTFTLDFDKE